MLTTRRAGAVALVTLTALGLSACKSNSDMIAPSPSPVGKEVSPKLVLRDAAKDLAAQQAVRATFTLKGAPEDVAAALNSSASSAKDATRVTAAQASDLLGSNITVTVDQGRDRASAGDNTYAVDANYAGGDLFKVRQVADKTYLLVDTTTLAKKNPKAGPALEQIRPMAAMLPGAEQLLDGKWVYVAGADLKALTKSAGAAQGVNPATDPAVAKETLAQVTAAVSRIVEKTEVTRDGADATHLVAKAKVSDLATEVDALQKDLAKQYPSLAKNAKDSAELQAAKASHEQVVVDFWVKDGSLTAVSLNLSDLAGTKGKVALRVDLAPGAAVVAPPAATKLDLAALTAQK